MFKFPATSFVLIMRKSVLKFDATCVGGLKKSLIAQFNLYGWDVGNLLIDQNILAYRLRAIGQKKEGLT